MLYDCPACLIFKNLKSLIIIVIKKRITHRQIADRSTDLPNQEKLG